MSWIDWCIVFVPLLIVLYLGLKSQRYVHGVAGFLAADRVAGRYVVAVASGEAAMGLISVIAMIERDYSSGIGFTFWDRLVIPLTLLFALTGYCTYRFRETKALTMGQFLEMRYSRAFRIFAACLQAFSGILNYAIFPAVGARFLIYFLNLPVRLPLGSLTIPTTAVVMALFLGVALFIALLGGQVTIMVTDCIQGLLSYPMYILIIGFVLYRFSWWNEIAPTLHNRVAGESFLNPYDIKNLRNFNAFYITVGLFSSIFNRMAWSGSQGYNGAAKNAHEQKMGGVLGTWRSCFSTMMYTILAIAAFTYLNHPKFAVQAHGIRLKLAEKAIDDVAAAKRFSAARKDIKTDFRNIPVQAWPTDGSHPLSQKKNLDTPYHNTADDHLKGISGGGGTSRTFRTIYRQMLVPVALREMLPTGIVGVFCAIMIFLMVSTDTTYMHSWGGVIAQDIILPLRKKPLTPKQHLLLLRCCIVFVCLTAYFFSLFFSQLDYIKMFMQITGAIWMGGAGSCIVFGLYSRRGTTAGAFAALISGSTIAIGGFILQANWVDHVYKWLKNVGWLGTVDRILRAVSSPFDPYIKWYAGPKEFPINSQEILFISMVCSIFMYITVSLLTCRKPFNLDRMLHRGIYDLDGTPKAAKEKFSFRSIPRKLLGITDRHTTGDKIISWTAFLYSFGYCFMLAFLSVVVWNSISPWSTRGWSWYFLITSVLVAGAVALASAVWFTIGGIRDLRALFKELRDRQDNALDDGSVTEHVSAAEAALMAEIEKNTGAASNGSAE